MSGLRLVVPSNCPAFLLISLIVACGGGTPAQLGVGGTPAQLGSGVIGSWEEPFVGSPPFPNLICCLDDNECSDGNEIYQGCRMPDSVVGNLKLCGYSNIEGNSNSPEEFPFICDRCPGGIQDECDGTGWVEVAENHFQCDGPVYRGEISGVRNVAGDTWYIPDHSGGEPIIFACNDSYDLCESAACFEQGCISCASINTSGGPMFPMCEPGAQCHSGELEGSTALLCCSEVDLRCIRPNATTGDCSGGQAYEEAGFTTLASCAPCPTPDNPDAEEICHGWDLGDDAWSHPAEELGSQNSLDCDAEDEAGCSAAIYACDGTLSTTAGVELADVCTTIACDGD